MRASDLGVQLPNLPVDKSFDADYGVSVQVAPGIRRVLARNANAFTFKGTGTYIVGQGDVAVIDPGPLLDEHVDAIVKATTGERVTHILITHTHNDHSPAAAPLKALTGAKTYGFGRHGSGKEAGEAAVEEGGDVEFVPDVMVRDGDRIAGSNFTFEAVYTPGHTSNHVCFAHAETASLFCGDHVMGWSTTVIAPPDGNMAQYFSSLEKLLKRGEQTYIPTHGNPIAQPHDFVRKLIAHRMAREEQIAACLRLGMQQVSEMVAVIYSEVDKRLHPAASRSVLAHLAHMSSAGRVRAIRASGATSHYQLVS